MRYQEEEKGLFTFYRQQQQQEEENTTMRKGRKRQTEQKRKQDDEPQLKLKEVMQSEYLTSYKLKPRQTIFKDSPQKQKDQLTHVKQYGNSVIIINRMQSQEQKSQVNYVKQSNIKLNLQENGYYLENKQIQFDPSNRTKVRGKTNNRKTSLLNRKFERSESLQPVPELASLRRQLPPLIKTQDYSKSPYKSEIKKLPFALKSNGSDFIRELKNKITHQMTQFTSQRRHSVSFIEYNQDYLKAGQVKKCQQLTQEQKRVLELLYRYRSPNL